MTVWLKNGGVWRATPTGGLWIKYNGAWVNANKVYVKSGGAWRDSGHIGYPHPPLTFQYYAAGSSFSTVTCTWSGPTSGAAVSYYQVVKTDQWGNWYGGYPASAGTAGSYGFPVGMDERSQFYVRSVSAAGLASGWAGPVRVQVGHTEITHQETFYYPVAWASSAIQIDLHTGYGGSAAIAVPSNVTVDRMEVHLWSNAFHDDPPPGYLSAESLPQRHIHYIVNDVVRQDLNGGQALTLYNPHDAFLYVSGPSNGGGWGLYPWGTDYSTGPYWTQRVNGSLQIHGTYLATGYRTVYDRYYAANALW